jgi:hypothetical protein
MGSSLSASFNFQRPLKSTPDAGTKRKSSLAQAVNAMIAAKTTSRMVDPL